MGKVSVSFARSKFLLREKQMLKVAFSTTMLLFLTVSQVSMADGQNVLKENAISLMQNIIDQKSSTPLNVEVTKLLDHGLEASGTYDAVFLGADCRTSDCGFNYLVVAHYQKGGEFRSVGIIARSWARRGSRLVKVIAGEDIRNLLLP